MGAEISGTCAAWYSSSNSFDRFRGSRLNLELSLLDLSCELLGNVGGGGKYIADKSSVSGLDLGEDFIKIFRSSCSSLLFRFLTKKMHENIPTVRMRSAAAAIVMPAICAMVRFNSPCTLTPSAPAVVVACVISAVGIGTAMVVDRVTVVVSANRELEVRDAVACDSETVSVADGTAPGMLSQMPPEMSALIGREDSQLDD